MAVFAETGTYLKFNDRPRSNPRALLWPVLVHRVLYPEPRQPKLNIFQRSVLGLIRAGSVRQDTIASLTGLHPELIALVTAQGVSNGWLNSAANALTDSGLRLLDDEEDELANLKAGYLFQDAVTGDFWPRIVAKLEQIEAVDPLAKFPTFVSERKTGKTLNPFLVRPDRRALQGLENELLFRAYRDYRKDYRSNQQLIGSSGPIKEVRLQGVQHLDEAPESARVVVWITGDKDSDEIWSVKDPFGLRQDAWWLETALTQLLDQDANLRKYLAPLIGIPDAGSLSNEEWLRELQKKTELDILIEFPWVERQPDIKRYFARLLKWREKIDQGVAEDSDLEAAIGDCQKLLEVIMQWLVRSFPADVGRIPSRGRIDEELVLKVLRALQIPSFTAYVSKVLARQSLKQVIRTCQNPTSSLKALLFAAGMGVLANPAHPLRELSSEDLQLEKLLDLADLRNQSSHGQSQYNAKNSKHLSRKLALENIEYAKNFTECFKGWM